MCSSNITCPTFRKSPLWATSIWPRAERAAEHGAAFVDIGQARNGVLYAGEVNWDSARLEGQPRRIELAFKSGDPVLVQVTKDPIGHKGARLTRRSPLRAVSWCSCHPVA